MDTLTRQSPTPEAAALLAATPVAELLTKAYALTHRLDDAAGKLREAETHSSLRQRREARDRITDLRAARDLISAELIRRAGE